MEKEVQNKTIGETEEMMKVPVISSIEEFNETVEKLPNWAICPYLADKSPESWDNSTSRVYMNQVLDEFIYLPVNISRDDTQFLDDFLDRVAYDDQIVAINITQPHKSNPIVTEKLFGATNDDLNYDALIRDESGNLQPLDLNGPSFMGWYHDEVGGFSSQEVVLIGVGGVGEPIAKNIANDEPSKISLIDLLDKIDFAENLNKKVPTSFHNSVVEIEGNLPNKFVLINAAGKEGSGSDSAQELINKYADQENIFVDLRPQLDIDIVNYANQKGWQAYTGSGMNARNDYTLLQKIAARLGSQEVVSFEKFKELVLAAS